MTIALGAIIVFPPFAPPSLTAPDRALTPEETRHWPRVERKDGKKNPIVIAIQYLLRAHGHEIVVDGIFGRQTWREIRKFQADHQLPVDGIVDDLTWEKLVIKVRIADRGNAVRAAQARLRGHGYKVPVTGFYDPQTRRAAALFQSGPDTLRPTGVIDYATWCYLVNGFVAP